jgi:hypothetical protein
MIASKSVAKVVSNNATTEMVLVVVVEKTDHSKSLARSDSNNLLLSTQFA